MKSPGLGWWAISGDTRAGRAVGPQHPTTRAHGIPAEGDDVTVTTADALRAQTNLRYIADRWPDLKARLRPGGGNALTGMPGGDGSEGAPIDVAISDLMFEIESEARSLGYVLLDETTDWAPRSSRMPTLLIDVTERYGHWTAGDERTALAFCDWAEVYAVKVQRALERPAPAGYVGPCQQDGCDGELYLRPGRDHGQCRDCGTAFTREDQMRYVEAQMETRLMTQSEIVTALVVLDCPVPAKTVQSWAQRHRLIEAIPGSGLYRLADAMTLAEQRGKRVSA